MNYKKHYGLKEAPFRLSPDPDFFFPSQTHRDALETLLYSIRSGEGFIQITGKPGTGKSMLLRKILKDIGDSVMVGLILHSNIQAGDLLQILMQDFKIDISQVNSLSRGNLVPLFRDFLLDQARAGNQVIIIVDEAQNLPDDTLEELRMLSNLETEKTKLLQIILVGQLELEEKITRSRLSQLAQRITIRYRLKPLTREETRSYIFHRLEIASISRETNFISFQAGVMGAIHKYTGGIPRLINIVCERCLMAACLQGTGSISRNHLKKAIMSIEGEPEPKESVSWLRPAMCILFVMFLLTASVWGYLRTNQETSGTNNVVPPPGQARVKPTFEPPIQPSVNPQVNLKPQTLVTVQKTPEKISHVNQAFVQQPTEMNELAFINKWICMPMGVEQVGLINMDKSSLVMVKKQGDKLIQTEKISLNWPYPQGIYMAGYVARKQGFLFHPEFSYLKTMTVNNPEFWKTIKSGIQNSITPIIALKYNVGLAKGPEYGADTVQKSVIDWAATWRSMDLDKIMSYFSNVTSIYDINMEQPLVFSKTRMYTLKQGILQESGFIKLNISDPICLINPLNPNMAYAVFHQAYQSQAYQDQGIKVLYFRRISSSLTDPGWKITGKLWILDPGKPFFQ